jgi:plastocyanin
VLSLVVALGLVAALAAPAAAYAVASVTAGGVLTGVVRFAGVPPEPLPSRAGAPRDACRSREDAAALVLGPGRGVPGSVVLVEGVERGKGPATGAVLDTTRCAFEGHVTAVMTGERAHVRNDDAILHNPQGFQGGPAVFNLALPGRGQTIDITRRLARPGVIRVVCDLHPNMGAWIVVHDSPYYAVTDERGGYRIDGIPPGRYRITMWHEGFRARGRDADGRPRYDAPRTLRKDVTIGPGTTATMDFELR